MKICYLVLAHNNPDHFGRLVKAIATPESSVFVHIDSKAQLRRFTEAVSADGDVEFISKRVAVWWGSFSIVQATLNLVKAASRRGFDYYILLSGSDYPLKSPNEISEHLARNSSKEFINLVSMPNEKVSKSLSRLSTYHISAGSFHRFRIPAFVSNNLVRAINSLNIQRSYKDVFGDIMPFAGSQWWTLSRSAVDLIGEFVRKNPRLVRFYANTKIPDESFFHTIIGNSRSRSEMVRSLTFTDWSRDEPPYPAIIDSKHIQFFKQQGDLHADDIYGKGRLLFARKFPNDSADLVAAIRENVW